MPWNESSKMACLECKPCDRYKLEDHGEMVLDRG
jgi:hypothetical protein